MARATLILRLQPELKAEVFRAARETDQSASRFHAGGAARRGSPGPCATREGGIQPGRSPMTWPGWGEVLPLLVTLLTAVATVIGAVVTWARISDRTVLASGGEGGTAIGEGSPRGGSRGERRGEGAGGEAGDQRFPRTWRRGSIGGWPRPGLIGKAWRCGSGSGSTAWADASSAWRPGCWPQFSGGPDTDDSGAGP